MTTRSYAEHVEEALHAWQGGGQKEADFDNLTSVLGCPYMDGVFATVVPTAPENESIVQAAWIAVFKERDPESPTAWRVERFVLAGVLQNDRWRTFLSSETSAREFVRLCARFLWMADMIETPGMPVGDATLSDIRGRLQQALTPWRLCTDQTIVFSSRDLASCFFGEAWCCFVYDTLDAGFSFIQTLDTTQPEFLPGRLTQPTVAVAEILPSIAIS
jgi:hypothetical protein